VSTIDVKVTTAVAIVVRIDCASVPLPTIACESNPLSFRWSIATVRSDRPIPVRMPSDGITQSRCASACTIRYDRMAAR
jgi:hypothetical protein